jgi:cellulose synthase/poly-beta-1,6-N-acetylglucosamine synthase-like glycosyltransferase
MSGADPRLGPIHWPMPGQRSARRRALLMAVLCTLFGAWYLHWLLQGERVGSPLLYVILIAAEGFNLTQAIGFWWTCASQRLRGHREPANPNAAVDVMIPVYDEPRDVVEPTVAAARRMEGAGRVWLCDDGDRPEMAAIAKEHGAGYITRSEHGGAKAGNLNHALSVTDAPYVAVLDCDHVPRPSFLTRTLGHLQEPGVAFVQTPQYYANGEKTPVAAAAAAQQNLFFGPISRGKDGVGSTFCCGTNVVFRRQALEEVGGFAEDSLTEDFELSVRMHEKGWRSAYVPEVLACGLGPEDMASYVSQQQRWARGCLSGIPAILRSRMPLRLRLQYLLSATYFLSGWTLLVYMSLPVIRILTDAQPLAASTADQFLLHFGPYYVAALATVALAGYGTYTFDAFALAAGSFWIHIQATINSLLRRPARFVVTPKHGTLARQPGAVAPALAAIVVLVGVSVYGLAQSRGAATLNNVAFASLHASILLSAVIPALRVRPSPRLQPERPPPRRAWPAASGAPRPVAIAAIGVSLLVPIALGVLGASGLADRTTLSEKAHASAESFMTTYVGPDGRVSRADQGGDTVSEGQAYGMLLAAALDDRARFETIWHWTQSNLQRDDGLLAYHWANGGVESDEPATDADLDAARALALAGERFGSEEYRREGVRIGQAVLERETADPGGQTLLAAGPWATGEAPVINPSYFAPRAYADLAEAEADGRWEVLAATSRSVSTALTEEGDALPPDWASLPYGSSPGSAEEVGPLASPIADPGQPGGSSGEGEEPASGLDADRLAVRLAESCIPADRKVAGALWSLYKRDPGRLSYSLDGSARDPQRHPVALVAAAASAEAAEDTDAAAELLDRAEALDEQQPTYYGSAWVALGRVMLTSSALGSCSG